MGVNISACLSVPCDSPLLLQALPSVTVGLSACREPR